jgi:gas vesicle protein
MAQRDGFTGGFIFGAIAGGIVGGILGTILAKKLDNEERKLLKSNKQKQLDLETEENIEGARRNLEDKIAQLNLVIDDVRDQLGTTGNVEQSEN